MEKHRPNQRQQLDEAVGITLDYSLSKREKYQKMEEILVTMTAIERIFFQTMLSAEVHRVMRENKK